MYCNIIVTRPFNKVFTYDVGEAKVKKGQIVLVPFGQSKEVGMILETNVSKSNHNIKTVHKIFSSIYFNEDTIDFIKWISSYTLEPIGSVLKLFVINDKIIEYKLKTQKKIKIVSQSVNLNLEQNRAKKNILNYFKSSSKPVVLEGVTGSGKTEVYFEIIEKNLRQNKQLLIMLPEISLTSQLEKRLLDRFGIEVDIWHSRISEKKRQDIWHRAYRGDVIIVIGARSSLFLPFSNLGLIIIDEEHDHSYKQEDNIRYQARDLAVVRSKYLKNYLILTSATPSLETQNNINNQKYKHVFLPKQYSGLPLPYVEIVDLTTNKLEKKKWISKLIINELTQCFKKKQQALIFLNRRGYSPLNLCTECGYRIQCQQCSSWLVLHQQKKRLLCHQCGKISDIKYDCSQCLSKNSINYIGPGVERIAEELSEYFPDKKISIMSSDTTNTSNKIKSLINRFSNNKIDILVATQIMAKGHDFPNLSLVGIVDADAGLFGGDMRAIEKTFNLLQQVSGRAGRSQQKGKVMIQTYYPQQPLIQALKNRDRKSFMQNALHERKKFQIPPFGYMTAIITKRFAFNLIQYPNNIKNIDILGPVEAPIYLLRGKYRYRILLKGNSRSILNEFTRKMLNSIVKPTSLTVIVDVDPYTFM